MLFSSMFKRGILKTDSEKSVAELILKNYSFTKNSLIQRLFLVNT